MLDGSLCDRLYLFKIGYISRDSDRLASHLPYFINFRQLDIDT
jgi:hypothetical protein